MQSELENLIKRGESSPFYNLLNIEIDEVRDNYACLSIEIEEKHRQFLGTVHGGVVASLADSVAAWAVYGSSNLADTPLTVEMKINFLKPIQSGKLTAEAINVHQGSRIFVSDVHVKDEKGNLIAKSLVTYYLLKRKKAVATR